MHDAECAGNGGEKGMRVWWIFQVLVCPKILGMILVVCGIMRICWGWLSWVHGRVETGSLEVWLGMSAV